MKKVGWLYEMWEIAELCDPRHPLSFIYPRLGKNIVSYEENATAHSWRVAETPCRSSIRGSLCTGNMAPSALE